MKSLLYRYLEQTDNTNQTINLGATSGGSAVYVKMYVNEVTVNMGDSGEASIRKLFEMAKEKNLVTDFELNIATK